VRAAGNRLRGWAITALSGLLAALLRGLARAPRIRQALRARATHALAEGDLLFVCHGNINRSAFAAELARRRWPARNVREAGTRARAGRPSSPLAISAAERWQIDLRSHRSEPLDGTLLRGAPALFVFDARNLVELALRHPLALRRAHLLGWLCSAPGGPEIADPHGGPPSAYEAAFGQIAAALLDGGEHNGPRLLADA
jgi:protein-tyrosine phosphatase